MILRFVDVLGEDVLQPDVLEGDLRDLPVLETGIVIRSDLLPAEYRAVDLCVVDQSRNHIAGGGGVGIAVIVSADVQPVRTGGDGRIFVELREAISRR